MSVIQEVKTHQLGGGGHISTDGHNNIKNTIPTIPSIYIEIYQRKKSFAEGSINTTGGNDSSTGRTVPITDKTQSQKSKLSISILQSVNGRTNWQTGEFTVRENLYKEINTLGGQGRHIDRGDG